MIKQSDIRFDLTDVTKTQVGLGSVENAGLDTTPTDGSGNYITSNAVHEGLTGKADDSQVLTDVPSDAVFTDTVYSHPSYTSRDESCDTGAMSGATVISDLDFNITTDSSGHVTACEVATVATRTLTASNIGAAALTGATFTGVVAYEDTSFVTDIDCASGNSFSKTVDADFTQTFSNVPSTGNACVIVLKLVDAGAYVITWDSSIKWVNGRSPAFTENGIDSVTLYTVDGGTNWFGNTSLGYV